ncbi:MAG: glycosyltransferase family 1 protein [Vulcanimicrobiaceae bacterium]
MDVALDLPRVRHMSVGMRAYAEELARRLPRVAPDLRFRTLVRTNALDAEEQVVVPIRLRATRARLVHHLAVYAPLVGLRPSVITIHDLIHLRFPTLFKRRVGPYYATVVRGVCARAACVVTDDERTVEDLERYLGVPPRKVAVIPLGVDDAFLAAAARADASRDVAAASTAARPYFLYVGNHRAHKDLPTLFAAWQSLPAAYDVDLRVTGCDDLAASGVRPSRTRGALVFAGDVATAALVSLYAGATALVHPALCEGFGLSLLEASAMGTPVIACAQSVPGVLGGHVASFAPGDVAGLRAHMLAALDERRDASAARAVARNLTWDRCAMRTAEVYRRVLADSPVR